MTQDAYFDKSRFVLDTPSFKAFDKALRANPIGKNESLAKLLKRPVRWAKG